MSSILKALKKLEEESLNQDQSVIVPQKKMKQVVSRRAAPPRRMRWLVIVGTLIIISMASVIAWDFISLKNKKKVNPISNNITSGQTIVPQKGDNAPSEQASALVPPSTPLQTKDHETRHENAKTEAGGDAQVNKLPPEPSNEHKLPPSSNQNLGTRSLLQSRGNPNSLKMRNIPSQEHKEITSGTTQHPELKLNGILWSDNPERRVALINDRYLKEGDSINGIFLMKIDKKGVTFQSGDQKWTVPLKK